MKQSIFTILSNEALTDAVYRMVLSGDTSHITNCGQFVNIQLDGLYLRRPISVCDYDTETLTLVYKVVGKGTAAMSRMAPGACLDILTGLGNGYDLTLSGDHPVLLGGGVGVPPMYNLAKKLVAQGKQVSVVLGFNTASEIFYEAEFKALGCTVTVTTVDGSYGVKGFVTDALPEHYTYFYTCGPEPMLKAVYKVVGKGTEAMSHMAPGKELDILTGLGNGYDLTLSGQKPVLLGGGVGVPPMYNLAKKLREMGKEVKVILGFNVKSEIFYEEEFKALGCDVTVTTVDGSYGVKGFVTTALEAVDYTYFYTCGPEPMLKAVYKASKTSGQMSFEERMGCGFGACMGCSCKTLTGYKRICKDGPVMKKEEILWET